MHIKVFTQVPCFSLFLPQVVFVGMGISSLVWGNVCDKYGRKVVSSLVSVFIIYAFVNLVLCLMFNLCVFCICFCGKQSVTVCMCWTLYYSLLSPFAPEYGWLLVLRGLVGFGIGGTPQS